MKKTTLMAIGILLLLTAVLSGCTSSGTKPATTTTTESAPTTIASPLGGDTASSETDASIQADDLPLIGENDSVEVGEMI